MLSPSLSLTFSKLLSIILPRCATLERPVRRRFGKRFTLLCRLGEAVIFLASRTRDATHPSSGRVDGSSEGSHREIIGQRLTSGWLQTIGSLIAGDAGAIRASRQRISSIVSLRDDC